MTPANVHDINYMKDVKFEFHDCSIFGDRAYISAELKQDLFRQRVFVYVSLRCNQQESHLRIWVLFADRV